MKGGFQRLSGLGIPLSSRRLVEVSALLLILFTAFTLRFLPIRWGPYLAAYDPYFQYRMAEYVVENGFQSWFTWYDDMSWYPIGRNMPRTAYPGVAFSGASIYLFLKGLGLDVSLLTVCLLFPVVMGTLTCLILYFFGRDIGGREVGLFASFFLAINNAFIGRTSLGFFDNESIGVPGMVLTFLCFLRSLEEDKPLRNRLLYALAAGITLCYVTGSWGAARYAPAVLALYTLVMLLRGRYSRNLLISYTIPIALAYSFSLLIPTLSLRYRYLRAIDSLSILALIPLLGFYDLFKHTKRVRNRVILVAVLIILLAGGLWFLERGGYVSGLAKKFWGVINPWSRVQNPLVESVAEHRRSSWGSFFRDFGITLSLSLVGIYFSLKQLDPKKLLVLLYFATSLYFAGSMIRLTLILSAAASLMAAYGLVELSKPFMEITLEGFRVPEARRRRLRPRMSPELGGAFLITLFLISAPTVVNSVKSAYTPGSLACSGVPARLSGGGYPQDWIEALTWIRNNLNSDNVVVSWWDYGYWLTGIGGVKTLADGGTLNGTQIQQIAKIYMYNQTESLKILRRYDADYILVFLTYNPNQRTSGRWPPEGPNQMWPLGDNVKWSWMAQIARLNVSDYLAGATWTDKFKETTIYNLMFRTADPDHFQLAFSSTFGYVLIYRIEY